MSFYSITSSFLTLSTASKFAPHVSSRKIMSICPLLAALWSGVDFCWTMTGCYHQKGKRENEFIVIDIKPRMINRERCKQKLLVRRRIIQLVIF